jgi:hypothetical protein
MNAMLAAAALGLFSGVAAPTPEARPYHEARAYHMHRHFGRPHVVIAPRFERVWVEPCVERRFVGYDACGQPMYRTICVTPGYWTTREVPCN